MLIQKGAVKKAVSYPRSLDLRRKVWPGDINLALIHRVLMLDYTKAMTLDRSPTEKTVSGTYEITKWWASGQRRMRGNFITSDILRLERPAFFKELHTDPERSPGY